jgi:hypothetical protein
MSRTLTLALLLALPLAACQGGSSAPSTPSGGEGVPVAPTASLTVQDPDGGAGPFALDALERLTIGVRGKGLSGESHRVRLDVTDPSGVLYAQLPAALAPAGSGEVAAVLSLQVRGTTIETFRQVGTWQVSAWIDGAPLASAAVAISE